MASLTRRQLVAGATGAAALAAGGTYIWNHHQSLPPRDPAAEERFSQAQHRLLQENGAKLQARSLPIAEPRIRVQVLEGGQGDPLLMLHGGSGMAEQFEPLLSRLTASSHVYAPDRPGCGLTDMFSYSHVPLRQHAVDFVGSTMDALGLKSANILGNSMGGYFSLVFALAHPERVTRLITIGEPAGSSADAVKSQGPLTIRGINGLLYSTVMKPGPKATYEGFRRKLVVHPERLTAAYLDCCTAESQIPGAVESWITLLEDVASGTGASAGLTYALRPELSSLTMPVLMIWGENDTFGPPSLAAEMAHMIPHGEAETIRDAGHLVWLDQPNRAAASIQKFLRA